MLWQKKKKRKKATKSKAVTQTAPHQPAEELPQTAEPEEKEETPKQKKPAGKKCKKVLSPEKAFLDAFGRLTNRYRAWDVWRDFITMFACSLSNPLDKEHRDKREVLYLEIIKKYNKQEQELFPELAAQTVLALEENPEQDFLGSIFMSLNLGNESNGQFFTPYHVCELMAEVTMDNTVQKVEQDVDSTVALMCYIQLSLLGVAGMIKIGNSLTEPITNKDSTENYWFTPMYFSPIWTARRFFGRC